MLHYPCSTGVLTTLCYPYPRSVDEPAFYDRVSVHASVGVDPTSDEDEPKDSLQVRLAVLLCVALSHDKYVMFVQYCVDCSHVALSCMRHLCCTCHLELYLSSVLAPPSRKGLASLRTTNCVHAKILT